MRALIIVAALVATSVPLAEASGGYGGKCLRFRDLRSLTQINDTTLLATTRSSAKYTVALRHSCRSFNYPGNYYTVRLYSDTECLDRDDVLVMRYGGACFIQSVTPVAPASS